MKIHDYASTPIINDLGLKLSADGTATPRGAYWMSFDCTFGEGENIYVVRPDAAAGPKPGPGPVAVSSE